MRSWKDKLTSRKFWAAVVGVVISVMVMFGADEDTQAKTVGIITASAVLVSYIVGEGMTDKAHVNDANSTALYTAMMKYLTPPTYDIGNMPILNNPAYDRQGDDVEALKESEKDDNNNS